MPEIQEQDQNNKIADRLSDNPPSETKTYTVSPGVTEVKMQVPSGVGITTGSIGDTVTDTVTTVSQEQIQKSIDNMKMPVVLPTETATGKKTRTRKVVNKPVGGMDVKDLVQKLTNQAAVAMWVDNLKTPEILDTLVTDKGCRDIMITFQKAVDKAKAEAIAAIQSL